MKRLLVTLTVLVLAGCATSTQNVEPEQLHLDPSVEYIEVFSGGSGS